MPIARGDGRGSCRAGRRRRGQRASSSTSRPPPGRELGGCCWIIRVRRATRSCRTPGSSWCQRGGAGTRCPVVGGEKGGARDVVEGSGAWFAILRARPTLLEPARQFQEGRDRDYRPHRGRDKS